MSPEGFAWWDGPFGRVSICQFCNNHCKAMLRCGALDQVLRNDDNDGQGEGAATMPNRA